MHTAYLVVTLIAIAATGFPASLRYPTSHRLFPAWKQPAYRCPG